jgi:hypothetical protein
MFGVPGPLETAMSTPTVTEIRPRPEAVTHDTFIDDLSRGAPIAMAAYTTAEQPSVSRR